MRGDVRRIFLVAMFAALAVLATNGASSCRAKAAELKPAIYAPEKPVQRKEGEVIYEQQDPCNWQDWPWWVRVVIGCPPPAGGGSSGAGLAKPAASRRLQTVVVAEVAGGGASAAK